MAPNWTFNLVHFPLLTTQPPSKVKSGSFVAALVTKSQGQLSRTIPPSRQVSAGNPAEAYGKLHLLGLPSEVRLAIWRAIHHDVVLGSEEPWFHHPSTAWDGLRLTCKQISAEIADFWPCMIIPQARVNKVFTQVLSIELLANFRRLALELPFNMGHEFYESLAFALKGLASVLEDLRLFFVGKDRFNVESFVQGCGSRDSSSKTSSTKLVVDGQREEEQKALFFVLFFLIRLRSLVISNANYPLLQSMIIKYKPQLEYLHISTDPRSCLHTKHDLENKQQLILPPKGNYPPVKVLHISTNAAVTALQVAVKVSRTIKELNWTMPDVTHQLFLWHWLEQTVVLLDNLGMYAHELRTLRMCIHTPLYEAHHSEGTLIDSLKQHLPCLTSLETLELHIHAKANFSGEEIIFAIPDSVKRLYISDKLISAQKLERLITQRYLWSRRKASEEFNPMGWTIQTLEINDNGGWPVGPQATRFLAQTVRTYRGPRKCYYTNRKGKRVYIRYGEIIGEAYNRIDHIPFRPGKLGFIGYEYQAHAEGCECGKCDEVKLILLRLNGRLLDRERNNHLARVDRGLQILPRFHGFAIINAPEATKTAVTGTLGNEVIGKITELEKEIIETAVEDERKGSKEGETCEHDRQDAGDPQTRESGELRTDRIEICKKQFTTEQFVRVELEEFEQIINKLNTNTSNKFSGYLGTEEAAVQCFKREMTVMEWELPERKWAEDTTVGAKEHWLSEA
jgi:hypothetical protein